MTDHCASHVDARSSGRCASCHRPFCPECVVEDVAANLFFCSAACRHAHQRPDARDPSELVAGLRTPVRTGWRLALGRAGRTSLWVGVPVGLGYGLLRVAIARIGPRGAEASLLHGLALVGCLGLAVASVGIILSDAHTGAAFANPWPRVAARILPWAATWLLAATGTFAGSLLVVPGIIAGIRLFWADEFALVHRHGSLSAMRESIELTRGLTNRIFSFQFLVGLVWGAPLLFASGFLFLFLGAPSDALGSGPLATVIAAAALGVLVANVYALMHGPEVVYFYGLRALHSELPAEAIQGDWVARALRGIRGRESHPELCPACGAAWDPNDYRADAERIYCSSCRAELVRSMPGTPAHRRGTAADAPTPRGAQGPGAGGRTGPAVGAPPPAGVSSAFTGGAQPRALPAGRREEGPVRIDVPRASRGLR